MYVFLDVLFRWILAPFWRGFGRGLEALGASWAICGPHFLVLVFGMLSKRALGGFWARFGLDFGGLGGVWGGFWDGFGGQNWYFVYLFRGFQTKPKGSVENNIFVLSYLSLSFSWRPLWYVFCLSPLLGVGLFWGLYLNAFVSSPLVCCFRNVCPALSGPGLPLHIM